MDMQAIKDEVTLKLTGDVLELELSDTSLTKIINSSLRELQRYIDITKLVTVPYKRCIDLSEHKVSSVSRVYRTVGFAADGDDESTTNFLLDPMYASQWQLLSGMGNAGSISDYTYNYASWNTLLQIRNTTSTDLAFRFDKSSNLLYINVSTNIPESITVEYVPRYDDVSQITSDYWIDILIRLSVALTKVTVGRVRSKFKQSNALWTLDGDQLLEEGNAELTQIREKLEASSNLCYPID